MKLKMTDVVQMVDVHLYGSEEEGRTGWVEMYANEKGREIINDLIFAHIEWKPMPSESNWPNAAEMKAFEIHLPSILECVPGHRLTTDHLVKAAGHWDGWVPKQWASMLAFDVRRKGGRVSFRGPGETMEILIPDNAN
jgi:hypothetical protein